MIAGRDRGRPRGGSAEVMNERDVFEELVYLGALVTCDIDVSREVKRRIATGNRAFA